MEFVIDHVTSVDGQSVPVLGGKESLKGAGVNTNMASVYGALGAVGDLLQKGYETLIRAGKHVVCAVPAAYSLEQCQRLVAQQLAL